MSHVISQLPWIEKYRPKNLDDIIDHQEKITVIRKMIQNHELPHLLLYGQPGSGKTSLILAATREMYGDSYRQYILELNASDQRGIDIVRTVIPEFAKVKSDHLRLIILDEVDSMTVDAQSALRRVMENYVKNCRFTLICNNITRIIPGIQSRCAKMRFGTLQRSEVHKKITQIIAQERVSITPEAVTVLLQLHQDLRQILNTLQCLHYIHQPNQITPEIVYDYVGQPTPAEMDEIFDLLNHSEGFHPSYERLQEILRENRWNFLDMIDHLCRRVIEIKDHKKRSQILRGLSEIEYRVVNGRDSELQLASLIALFN